MAYQVFISHAGVDNWIAWQLSQELGNCGDVEVFLDEKDLVPGDVVEQRILSEIATADELWILLTPNALHRAYVWMEVGAFWMSKKKANVAPRIVPFLYQVESSELQAMDNMPALVKGAKVVQLRQLDDYCQFMDRFRTDHQ